TPMKVLVSYAPGAAQGARPVVPGRCGCRTRTASFGDNLRPDAGEYDLYRRAALEYGRNRGAATSDVPLPIDSKRSERRGLDRVGRLYQIGLCRSDDPCACDCNGPGIARSAATASSCSLRRRYSANNAMAAPAIIATVIATGRANCSIA